MVRTARLLVHDEAPHPAAAPKKKRHDDLQAAIKGAVLQGTLGPEMRRLVMRMGERRGLDGAQVDAMIDHERKALEELQKKIRTALGKSPDDEAREAIRAAMWGAMVAGNVSAKVLGTIVERGSALGLDVETVRKVIDEVKAEWKVEREESLDTDIQGRWVPPHRRVQRDGAAQRPPAEGDGKWALDESLEAGLDDVVRHVVEERDEHLDLPELDLDSSSGFEPLEPSGPSREVWRPLERDAFEDRNAVTGASHVLSVRAIPVMPETAAPPSVAHVSEPSSSTTLSPPPQQPRTEEEEAKAKARVKALALHTALSTFAVMAGAFYGVTWFLLANRSHLF
jgi:hypothetical protein